MPLQIDQGLTVDCAFGPGAFLVSKRLDALFQIRDFPRKLLGLFAVERQFFTVIKSQHPVAAIPNIAAVVLLVSGLAVFNLALAGQGPICTSEGVNGVDAGVVKAATQLGTQPFRLIARFDIELEHQCIGAERSGLLAIYLPGAVIDQPLP